MKKLLFAAMAAAMASVASAATDWTFKMAKNATFYAGYKATEVGGTSTESIRAGLNVYFIAWDNNKDGYTAAQTIGRILEGYRANGGAEIFTGEDRYLGTSTTTLGGINEVGLSVDESFYTWETHLPVICAVVADSNIYIGFESNGASTLYINTEYSNIRRDIDGTTGYSSGQLGWFAIPEPTSGLLLLIGMAGLALKRKRA